MHDEVFCHGNAGQWIYRVHRTCSAGDSVAAVVEIRLRGILRHRYELARTALTNEALSKFVRVECVTWIVRAESSLARDDRLAADAAGSQQGGAPHGQRSRTGSDSLGIDAFGLLDEAELSAHELSRWTTCMHGCCDEAQTIARRQEAPLLSNVANLGAKARSLRMR